MHNRTALPSYGTCRIEDREILALPSRLLSQQSLYCLAQKKGVPMTGVLWLTPDTNNYTIVATRRSGEQAYEFEWWLTKEEGTL
jgi:hypothetical protein